MEEPKRSRILTVEQIDAVRRHCRPDRWPFIWTLLQTGARQGEVLNLHVDDLSNSGGLVVFRSQPGSKSRGKERYTTVSPELASCLATLGMVNGGRIFPFARTTVREWWKEICEAAAIRGVTLHGLRATFITMGLDSGLPGSQVQRVVGHSSLAMTERYYRDIGQSLVVGEKIRSALGLGNRAGTPSNSPSTHEVAQNLENV